MEAIVLLADYANMSSDGKLNVMGIFRQIISPQFPCTHSSMYLVIKLQAEPLETASGQHVLTARLIDADGVDLQQLEMGFKFPDWQQQGPRPEVNFVFNLNNVEFPYPGDYVFDVLVDGEDAGRLSFYLNELSPSDG
jgi:hypothetical protein